MTEKAQSQKTKIVDELDGEKTNTTQKPEAAAPDPFDPAALRMAPDYVESACVKKHLATVPVRKPHRHDFIRVRDGSNYRDTFGLIEYGDDKDFYLVMPVVAVELPGEFNLFTIYTAINRQSTLFPWPVRLPGPDGRQNEWWRSGHEAAALAEKKWVRVSSNKNLGAYEIHIADSVMSEPQWPEHSFRDLLRIGFRDRIIDRPDHLVIKQLRGLV
jgi:hypothetical protein